MKSGRKDGAEELMAMWKREYELEKQAAGRPVDPDEEMKFLMEQARRNRMHYSAKNTDADDSSRSKMRWIGLVMFLILPWAVIIFLGILNGTGALLVGTRGFWGSFIYRMAWILIGFQGLAALLIFAGNAILKALGIAGLALLAFFLLRNPVRDLTALSDPPTVQLRDCEAVLEDGEDSTYYYINGTDKRGKEWSFKISRAAYMKYCDEEELSLEISYLPYTKHVMDIDN